MDYRIIEGDCIEGMRRLEGQSVHCVVTSPPYFGLRDYGHDGQIGLEARPDAFVTKLVEVFREVRRVLRDDGTLWLNLGIATRMMPSGVVAVAASMCRRCMATPALDAARSPPA